MATKTITKTITLSPDDVAAILAEHFQEHFPDSKCPVKVSYAVRDIADDRFGGCNYVLTSVSITGETELTLTKR